jgi:hypothetical protein
MVLYYGTCALAILEAIFQLFLLGVEIFALGLETGWEVEELPDQGGLEQGGLEGRAEAEATEHQRGLDTTNLGEDVDDRE